MVKICPQRIFGLSQPPASSPVSEDWQAESVRTGVTSKNPQEDAAAISITATTWAAPALTCPFPEASGSWVGQESGAPVRQAPDQTRLGVLQERHTTRPSARKTWRPHCDGQTQSQERVHQVSHEQRKTRNCSHPTTEDWWDHREDTPAKGNSQRFLAKVMANPNRCHQMPSFSICHMFLKTCSWTPDYVLKINSILLCLGAREINNFWESHMSQVMVILQMTARLILLNRNGPQPRCVLGTGSNASGLAPIVSLLLKRENFLDVVAHPRIFCSIKTLLESHSFISRGEKDFNLTYF